MTTDSANDRALDAAAETDADDRADRAWSLRVYGLVVLSFVLWVVALVILQRTFS
jgi:hypothetical protein